MKQAFPFFLIRFLRGFIVAFLLWVTFEAWFLAEKKSQLQPHHIVSTLDGRVMADFWATNNTYVAWSYQLRPVTDGLAYTNGLSYVPVPHTNEYWHIWKCFQK